MNLVLRCMGKDVTPCRCHSERQQGISTDIEFRFQNQPLEESRGDIYLSPNNRSISPFTLSRSFKFKYTMA